MSEIMKNENEIQEMRKVVGSACNREGIAKHCPERITQAFLEAGYRKEKDVAKEIFDRLIKIANTDSVDGIPNPNIGYVSVGMLKAWAIEYDIEVVE